MNDKEIMESLLFTEKTACDLYLHGVIESTDPKVRSSFQSALDQSLKMQNQIYDKMSQKGFYQVQNVEQQKIDTTRGKFSAS
ncbi:MAG: spore coat protein [Eubacteriales bacterium]|nr:spore coat protein [Eubacteriales bacterium]